MTNNMLIDAQDAEETRVVITDNNNDIVHFDFITKAKNQIKGNIYLAKITRVEPSLQAAFVEYGANKQGFLPFSEIHPDYYQIPVEDRKKLLEEAEAAAEEDEAEVSNEGAATPLAEGAEGASPAKKSNRRRRTRKKPDLVEGNAVADDASAEPSQDVAVVAQASLIEEGLEIASPEAAEKDADAESPSSERTPIKKRGRRKTFTKTQPALRDAEEDVIASEDIEDVQPAPHRSDEDEADEVRKKRTNLTRRYKIQEVIKPGQIILVQVVKEERGNKGVSLSSYLSLAGRYCVLMPNSPKDGGISRKIATSDDRKRLKEISDELKASRGMSAIIRTAGTDRTRAEIKRDYEYLIKLWNQVREDALSSMAPATVYEENDIIKRSIRDHYNGDIERILVQGEESYKQAKAFMKLLMPSHAPRVKHYKEPEPLFVAHNIERTIDNLYSSRAELPSGGYLIINPTEALISIDVNSGSSTNERNVEETAYKTNLEAAKEVARQLRLRNLGGLIVIDFIDMNYGKHRKNIERTMREAMKDDRARTQVGHISSFGLMELSRQRMGPSLEEMTTQACSHCAGTGKVMHADAIVIQLMRNLQSFVREHTQPRITLHLPKAVAQSFFNQYRTALAEIEAQHNIAFELDINIHDDAGIYSFDNHNGVTFHSVEGLKLRSQNNNVRRNPNNANNNNKNKRNNNNNQQQRHHADKVAVKPQPQQDVAQQEVVVAQEDAANTQAATAPEEGEAQATQDAPAKRKSRRSRNRRNKKREDGQSTQVTAGGDDVASEHRDAQESIAETTSEPIAQDVLSADVSPPASEAKRPQKRRTPPAQARQDNTLSDATSVEPSFSPLPKKQESLVNDAQTEPAEAKNDAPKKTRKGWWQRVVEG
jgi:ribonuclease E